MAGSASTVTYDDGYDRSGARCGIRRVLIDWTSDDSTGAVTITTGKIVGELIKAVTDPGATAPTDLYDIAITDEEGVDVLGACINSLANRSTSTSQQVYFYLTNGTSGIGAFPVVCDVLTIAVTNAGNSKTGQIILYYKPL